MKKLLHAMVVGICAFCVTSASAEDVSLKLPNGLTVKGKLALAEDKSLKEDGVVMFVHGTLAHQDMAIVSAQRDLLNERELNVLSVNLSLGLDNRDGMYDCALPHTHKHRDALDEIDAWLAWLKEKGVSNVVMMGHSRGGNQVAWQIIERPSDLVKKVVLVAPQTWTEDAEIAGYKKRYDTDLTSVVADMKAKSNAGKGAELNKGIDFIYCPKSEVTADAFLDYYMPDDRFNTPSLLPKITQPVLVVAGSEDTVVADLPAQMEKLDLAHLSYVMIDDADHMFIDFAGEDLADQVAEFIAGE